MQKSEVRMLNADRKALRSGAMVFNLKSEIYNLKATI